MTMQAAFIFPPLSGDLSDRYLPKQQKEEWIMLHDAFHFPSLVWDWPIAIYLFLLGISAGAPHPLGAAAPQGAGSESGIIKATAILAPQA